jgi:ketosteroid isomerase-like protein
MSSAQLELVRARWAAWDAGDDDALTAICHPDAEWDVSRLDATEGPRWISGETLVAVEDRVLIEVRREGDGGDEVAAVVHTLRGGRFTRVEWISDRTAAQLALTGTDPLAVVQAVWATWQALDMDRVVASFTDDVVYDLSHYAAWPGQPRYAGPTSMTQFLAEWMAWWSGYFQEVLGMEAHGRDVLVTLRHGGTRDGAYFEEVGALVYAVAADGRISGWTAFAGPDEAREWLGSRKAPAEAQ